ncbi:SAM-dependent methyltransferase [Parashewanella spongiae]|uniref:SAM-dependent methyltransferase n=1 Tax=Parashewanella spongiae TaxID=342950 RepID=A0A3A6U9J8_9GAMM|nr:class I SAM-dependent methyltransferase [Parashewanella spongiae]MCL1080296.1 class I SAM-dependent methyltransferase [Parashewanella spongiae]RJY18181.1 SAM-dependent methyltransferase [Parashewanella spongiae]
MQAFLETVTNLRLPKGACRLFHGRGGLFPDCEHLCLDWFAPVLLLTSFKVLGEEELQTAISAIKQRWKQVSTEPLNLVFQFRSGLGTQTQLITGEIPESHIVTENGAQFHIHLLRGQNHGLFLDMANGRQWVREHAEGKKILNLFSYTCAFSVAGMQGGASSVVNIDMAKAALAIGKRNHHLNNLVSNVSFLGHDIFKSWGKLKKNGPYDMIIADPPSNQKGSFVATKDYVKLLRRLPQLMADECELLLCLNAPELPESFLKDQVSDCVPELSFIQRLKNPCIFADIDTDKSLKVLNYRLEKL